MRMCARRARRPRKWVMRRGQRRAAAAAAAGLPLVAPPCRLRRRLRPLGRRRRGASPRASGVGRAAGTPALAPRLPPRGSRSRRPGLRGLRRAGQRRGLRGLRRARARRGLRRAAAATAAAVLPPVPLPRRLRRRVRPPGRKRRGASHRASGVGRAAGTPALALRLPLRGRRSRRRARAGSADGPRQPWAPRATLTTALARARAPRPRTRRLLELSRARGRRLRTPRSGVASPRTRSIERDVWLVLGGRARVRSALVSPRGDATCSATVITEKKGNQGGMGAWTGRSQR